MDRGAWQATAHEVAESDTTETTMDPLLTPLLIPGHAPDRSDAKPKLRLWSRERLIAGHTRCGVSCPKNGFPGGSEGGECACSAGDPGSIPAWGRSPGEGNGNPLQYPCLENPMDRGAWWAAGHGVSKSQV